MENKNQKEYLIKRKDLGYKISKGWYCEVAVNTTPKNTSEVKVDDKIYVAQNGYAVFGYGIVVEIERHIINSFRAFVRYAASISNVNDESFWMSCITKYALRETEEDTYYIFEYKLASIYQYKNTFPLEGKFLNQLAFYKLQDGFRFKESKQSIVLTTHIPTKLREELYHTFKIKKGSEHIIDIDHVVPADLGGPGNIIENLVPLGSSINRRKSNRVPSKIFDLGSKFDMKIPEIFKVSHNLFYSDRKAKNLARRIIEKINQQPLDDVKKDYQKIRSFHFPGMA